MILFSHALIRSGASLFFIFESIAWVVLAVAMVKDLVGRHHSFHMVDHFILHLCCAGVYEDAW